MTTFAVAGATGTLGTKISKRLRNDGHQVSPLARAHGVDLHTGAGLDRALAGTQVVIDASNAFPTSTDQDLEQALVGSTRRLVTAARGAGVQRYVFVSIVNVDSPAFDDFPYFLAKRNQEEVVRNSGIEHVIVSTTQWLEFATNPSAVVETEDQVQVENWRIQPIAADSVAEVVVNAATTEAASSMTLAGPEPMGLPQLTTALLSARGDTRPVTTAPASHSALADGTLEAPEGAHILGPNLNEWLQNNSR